MDGEKAHLLDVENLSRRGLVHAQLNIGLMLDVRPCHVNKVVVYDIKDKETRVRIIFFLFLLHLLTTIASPNLTAM